MDHYEKENYENPSKVEVVMDFCLGLLTLALKLEEGHPVALRLPRRVSVIGSVSAIVFYNYWTSFFA